MPLYEYQCQDCGDRTEVLQRFSDAPLTTCKVCGGSLKKLVSAPAFQFKGTGWYVTDYAGKDKSEKGSKPSDSKSGDGAGESSSGDSSASSSGESKKDSSTSKSEKSAGKSSSDAKKSASA